MCCLTYIVLSFNQIILLCHLCLRVYSFHLSVCQFICSFICLFEVTTVTLMEFTTCRVGIQSLLQTRGLMPLSEAKI